MSKRLEGRQWNRGLDDLVKVKLGGTLAFTIGTDGSVPLLNRFCYALFICRNNERHSLGREEEPNRFEGFDNRFREAAVQVVDEHNDTR